MKLSAAEFLSRRFDLPEGGRACELVRGEIVQYQSPDIPHGNAVLHLSKLLASYAQRHGSAAGATCFELGLLLQQNPDSLFFPAVSHFQECSPFAMSDLEMTDRVPDLVFEVVSDVERERRIAAMLPHYLQWGLREVWIIDTRTERVTIHHGAHESQTYQADDLIDGSRILSDFRVPNQSLFAAPEWWNPRSNH